MYRGGLARFKKAESLEPFSVANKLSSKVATQPPTSSMPTENSTSKSQLPLQQHVPPAIPADTVVPSQHTTQVGGGQSKWQPADWAIEPCPGVYYLEVMKDGEVLDRINLDKRRHIFGRQFPMCDFVLDHQSVSRQHAVVVPHKNGRIYVIDMGSAHGTFVANERLTKYIPMELEAGQSLKFAASTRIYILRMNVAALFRSPTLPPEMKLPLPDPSDEEAVLTYNTILNRYGISKLDLSSNLEDSGNSASGTDDAHLSERPSKKSKRPRVVFKDQMGGMLVDVVGISDGADVDTEPGPLDVKEGGSLVGKYESLVQITMIPKGKEPIPPKDERISPKGVTDKLQEVLNKVKSAPKIGIYDDLYGDSFSTKVGSSWAYKQPNATGNEQKTSHASKEGQSHDVASEKPKINSSYDIDDLFGDDE